jgi:hypothetical protein
MESDGAESRSFYLVVQPFSAVFTSPRAWIKRAKAPGSASQRKPGASRDPW